jgi:HSP20 family protein
MVANRIMPFARNGFRFEPVVDQWMDRAFGFPGWTARSEVAELEDRAEIRLEVPGIKPEQIQVSAEHRVITVRIAREGQEELTRQYTVGPQYDLTQVQARLELGVLTLMLPKAPEAQPRQIAVTVG